MNKALIKFKTLHEIQDMYPGFTQYTDGVLQLDYFPHRVLKDFIKLLDGDFHLFDYTVNMKGMLLVYTANLGQYVDPLWVEEMRIVDKIAGLSYNDDIDKAFQEVIEEVEKFS